MKQLLFLPCVLSVAFVNSASAAIGVVESTIQLNVNGTGTFYSDPGGNPGLPVNLGTFNPLAGDILLFDNWYFENYAFNDGPPDDIDHNNWLDGNTATLHLTFDGTTNSFPLTETGGAGNNKTWALNPGASTDLLALGPGTHTVSANIDYTFNWWDGSSANVGTSTSNSLVNSEFTVVPEPAVSIFAIFGMLLMVRRRR